VDGLNTDSMGSLDLDLDPDPGGQKMTHKNRKKLINFNFEGAGCSLLMAKGFSCSLTSFK
jgi:hypothetical protein